MKISESLWRVTQRKDDLIVTLVSSLREQISVLSITLLKSRSGGSRLRFEPQNMVKWSRQLQKESPTV